MLPTAFKSNPGYIKHKILTLRRLYTLSVRNTTVWIRSVDRLLRELAFALTGYLQRIFRALRRDDRTTVPSIFDIMHQFDVPDELTALVHHEQETIPPKEQVQQTPRALEVWDKELSEDEVDEASLQFDAHILQCTHLLQQIEVPTTLCDPNSDNEDPTPVVSSKKKRKGHRRRRSLEQEDEHLTEKSVFDEMSLKYGFDVTTLSPIGNKSSAVPTQKPSTGTTIKSINAPIVDVSRLVALYDCNELNIDIVPHNELRQLYKFLLQRDPTKKYPEIHELLTVDFQMMRDEPEHFNQPVSSYFDTFEACANNGTAKTNIKKKKSKKKR